MNRLPSSTSFQGVIDSIIRNYLLNELPPEGAENGNARHLVAEKDLGLLQGNGLHLHNPHVSTTLANVQSDAAAAGGDSEVNNNTGSPIPGTSTAAVDASTFADHEYIKAIYQCFEKRGVFKELQTFLRHKLVSILQDEWPNLQMPVSASQKEGPNAIVHRLVDDFLRCHKLLYTLSVLASESDVKSQSTRVLYGKLSAKEAEDLLDEMGIKRNSRLSGQILKCYFDKENFSLLESMHYLGIWIDDSSVQLDYLQQETNNNDDTLQRRRRGSGGGGEVIILSHGKRSKEKATETAPDKSDSESMKEKVLGGKSKAGVEQRLLELERNLEKEKEFKIKEAVEKYKREEQVKLREELETNFKLLLVEKEREHFLDVQKRMEEMNADMHKERQQWMDAKLKQEQELLEFRKKLNEMMHASGDHNNWKSGPTANPISNSNGEHSQQQSKVATKTATKTCQATLDDSSSLHKCSCRKRSPSSSPAYQETFSNHRHRHHSNLDPIEQDRLAFLQYRMEQQDEEIKTLKRQLLFSSQIQPVSKTRIPPASFVVDDESNDGDRQPELDKQRGQNSSPTPAGSTTPKADDLTTFLTESRLRVQKLDTAVEKIDEIVQELFSKRRSPLSKEASSRVLSSVMNKSKSKPSLSQVHSSLHNMSTVNAYVLPPMDFPCTSVPLVHHQVPERQRENTPSFFQSPPIFEHNPVFSQDAADLLRMPMNHYPSPPPLFGLPKRRQVIQGILKSPGVDHEGESRSHTPVDKLFEVAYGATSTKEPQRQMESRVFKKLSPESSIRKAYNNRNTGERESTDQQVIVDEPEVKESLFHMAIRSNNDGESVMSSSSSVKETLEEKAIRKGALSREKIISSDEGENENSVSLSLSLSRAPKVAKHVLKPKVNNGVLKTDRNMLKPISKSKIISETIDKVSPMKAVAGNGGSTPAAEAATETKRESASSQLVQSKDNSPLSSSSSLKAVPITRARNEVQFSIENEKMQQQTDDENDEQSSMNISVPKSVEGDGNNEDFWQL